MGHAGSAYLGKWAPSNQTVVVLDRSASSRLLEVENCRIFRIDRSSPINFGQFPPFLEHPV
jgi:hypothetical protein